MQINTSRKSGFTLVEIMIVVAIIGLLAAIAIPNFIKARQASQKNACIANMKQLQGATATGALELKLAAGAQLTDAQLFGASAYIAKKPVCPANGTYTYGKVDTDPVCSLAAAPDLHVLP
jgi:prepilin-type N-terminal cleavage/methylation domain-containing protein